MASKTEFDEFVARRASTAQQPKIDWTKKREEWLTHLSDFFTQVEELLHDYLSEEQIRIRYGAKRIVEEYIGEYEAKDAVIAIGETQITLDPIGTNLIGAKGRVDMNGPNGKVKFVLVDRDASSPRTSVRVWVQGEGPPPEPERPRAVEWAWKIGTPPPNIQYIELTQESFFDALMEVANG